MKGKFKLLILSVAALGVFTTCREGGDKLPLREGLLSEQADFYNLIDIKNVPSDAFYYDGSVFSDLGAWSGYALPENESNRFQGAFIGPMNMCGYWAAASLAEPSILVDDREYDFARNIQTSKYLPGRLVQHFSDGRLDFVTELCFATSRSVMVRSVLKNVSGLPLSFSLTWKGNVFDKKAEFKRDGNHVYISNGKDGSCIVIGFISADNVEAAVKEGLCAVEKTAFTLQPGETYQAGYTQTLALKGEDVRKELAAIAGMDVNACFEANEERWNGYLSSLLDAGGKYMKENKYRKVAVKAAMTLNSNFRSPAGDILHGGSYPSYNGFFGIWSWDSWKIASGNALYNTQMAKDEMRTLFDYQAENGMVPDFIGYCKEENNWRDSKPPLSAWGMMNVYAECRDKAFLSEMFDKIYKFHRWWYADRDHDRNGICEYGSTDGTLIAAAWESGMDNGVRFDNTVMLQNGEKAWSMNQESVCLNSFLYKEKKILSEAAALLGNKELAAKLDEEAGHIEEFVRTEMFDPETGFFYDTRIGTGEFVRVMGAEGWLPLWAGIATREQAERVKETMMNPEKFNSTLPLGTLDVSHPLLRPVRGYWRGPVWVDQVYFGITGLRNYGFDRDADYLLEKFIDNAQGLTADGPIHENYNPLTGEALNVPNFGWSSALIIKMLLNK